MKLGTMLIKGLYDKAGLENDEFALSVLEEIEQGKILVSEESYFPFPLVSRLSKEEARKMEKVKERYEDVDICHVIIRETQEGTERCYIIAPEDEEELKYNLKHDIAYAIVSNPYCTEMGSIGIKSCVGGFVRTA